MSMLSIIKEVGTITVIVLSRITGALYNFSSELQEKEGIKFKEEREAKKGWWAKFKNFIGKTIDFIFAPSTLKLITLISIGLLAFSPFGPIAIAVSATISVGCLISWHHCRWSKFTRFRSSAKRSFGTRKVDGIKGG